MRFQVCDSLSGRIVGQLYPSAWTLTEPLRAPGTGSLTVPLPADDLGVAGLVELTRPRIRWVAVSDDEGRYLFGGPIPRRPARSGGEVTVPLVDWRSWFYRSPLRPNTNGTRRNYIKRGVGAPDQAAMMTELMTLALATTGAPKINVDPAPATGITRDLTALQLDRSIGELLDDVMSRERGSEWFSYISPSADQQSLIPHVAVAWPERRIRTTPVRLEYRHGSGGNVYDYEWPEGLDSPSRVWAIGDGTPPAQAVAMDELPEVKAGADIAWEQVVGPVTGVKKNTVAFEHAFAAVQRGKGLSGTAQFSVLDDSIPLGSLTVGDRARVVLDDGWDTADVPGARITERTMTGGRNQPTAQRLTVDLVDYSYGIGGTPGTET